MSAWYVAPKERPAWSIDRGAVREGLASQWGVAATHDATRPFPLQWTLFVEGERLDGMSDDESSGAYGASVPFDGASPGEARVTATAGR